MNCQYITLFFSIVAGIVQIFIKSCNQLLYPRVIEVCRLPLNAYGAIAVTVAWIQECDEKHMFHLQSQRSPETHLLPVRSA